MLHVSDGGLAITRHDVEFLLERPETGFGNFDGVFAFVEDGLKGLSVAGRGEGGLAVVDGDYGVGFGDVEGEVAGGDGLGNSETDKAVPERRPAPVTDGGADVPR